MLRRLIAGFLMSCFVILSIPLAIAFGFYATFGDEDFYRGEFVDLSYELVVSQFPGMVDIKDHSYITEEDLIELAREVLQKKDLALVLDSLIAQFEEIEVDAQHEIEFSFPLSWLTGKDVEIADGLSGLLLEKLPKCDASVVDFNFDNLKCLPAGLSEKKLKMELEKIVKTRIFGDIHDEYVFALRLPSAIEGNFSSFLKDTFFFFFVAALVLLVVILILIALLVYKPWSNIMRVLAKTVFVSSFCLAINLWLVLWLPGALQENLSSGLESDILLSFSTLVLGSVVRKMLLFSMPILLISLVFYIFYSYKYKDYLKANDAS